MKAPDGRDDGKRKLPSSVEQQINENLRLLYQQRLEEDLPDKLKALVAQLRDGRGSG